MRPVRSEATLRRLREVTAWPDLAGTKYEVLDVIAQGGMATVFRARDRDLERAVALKVLTLPEGEQAVERLRREATIIARLEHPGIVPVHDVGRLPDGRLFYVMKLVHGRRLDEQAQGIGLADRLRMFGRVCEPVAFAHARGVVHRDLKPENVMVGAFGEVLVMDWGVAKVLDEPTSATLGPHHGAFAGCSGTAHGTVLGTPGYMAPEQARGEPGGIDERTDVHALGGILYFLLSGQAPLEQDGDLVPPRRLAPSLPRSLEAICLKALRHDPAQRYARVEELAAEVERFLSGAAVEAYPERLGERVARLGRRYQAAILLVAAYLAMRILLLVLGRSY